MTNPDRIPDLLLRLAANLAANGIVAVAHTVNLVGRRTRPAVKAAAVVGDRLLGSPVPQRDYEQALVDAEAEVDSLDPFYADGGPTEWLAPSCPNCDGRKCMGCIFREYDHDCADDCPLCCDPESSAPGHSPEPVAAESPSAAVSPAAAEGSPIQKPCECWPVENPWTYYGIAEPGGALEYNPDCPEHGEVSAPQKQPVGGSETGPAADGATSVGRAEHPLYRQIQEQADAAVVVETLKDHHYFRGDAKTTAMCLCGESLLNVAAWQRHVAPLIIAELQE